MMTSSNGNIFRVTGPLCGEFTGPGEFPTQRPVTRSFHVFFDLRLNKRLSKQSWGWWFETLSCPLWRHGNVHRFQSVLVKVVVCSDIWVIAVKLWCVYLWSRSVDIHNLVLNLVWICYIHFHEHFIWFFSGYLTCIFGLKIYFSAFVVCAAWWRERHGRLISYLWNTELWYNCWVI